MRNDCQIIQGNALDVLKTIESESVQCCITSPPYYGLRNYGVDGQLGLEPTPGEFLKKMVEVFLEARRVMRSDGTLWLNMGDSYNGTGDRSPSILSTGQLSFRAGGIGLNVQGLKAKDLIGMPWRLAFALQEAGFWLRQDIIWSKPNPMPESVGDRCTKSHEYIFLLTKSAKYYFNADAIKEPVTGNSHSRGNGVNPKAKLYPNPPGWDTSTGDGGHGSFHRDGRNGNRDRSLPRNRNGVGGHLDRGRPKQNESFSAAVSGLVDSRNKRSVWTVPTQPYAEAHFATFPEKLIEPCILAGSQEGDLVLDPFNGSGTTGVVSLKHRRKYIGIELNPDYIKIAERRLSEIQVSLI